MKILITGSAGFIGAAVTLHMLKAGHHVIGIDNHNSYYDPILKEDRLALFINHPGYTHLRIDLANQKEINTAFTKYRPQRVIHLAAQAGVRYSLENPHAYIDSNIVGFMNILEQCRTFQEVEHLVYASSSSVYGSNSVLPFSVEQTVDHPLSLYAASKKSNELMAHAYSHLYRLPTTGLRFFTAYGPWGRPDMALFKFTRAILAGEPIALYNNGQHSRDFTYIDDLVQMISLVVNQPVGTRNDNLAVPSTSAAPYRIFNVGSGKPVTLFELVDSLERALGTTAIRRLENIQPGDVLDTHADVKPFIEQFQYKAETDIEIGVKRFVNWYRDYFSDQVSHLP